MTKPSAERLLPTIVATMAAVATGTDGSVLGALDAAGTPLRRLAAARAVRDAGVIPPDAAFFLMARALLDVSAETLLHDSQRIARYNHRFEAIRRAHGLRDDEDWSLGQGPPEWEALRAEYERDADGRTAEIFHQYGEPLMAKLYLGQRDEFDRRYAQGREYFFAKSPSRGSPSTGPSR